MSADQSFPVNYALNNRLPAVTDSSGVTATLTVTKLIGVLYNMSGGTAAVTLTTPTAAAIVAAIPSCQIGDRFSWICNNANTSSGAMTLAGGTGVTLSAGLATTAISAAREYHFIVTNNVVGSEAVTVLVN